MSKPRHDIGDDEIRIISSSNAAPPDHTTRGRTIWLFGLMALVVIGAIILFSTLSGKHSPQNVLAVDTIRQIILVPDSAGDTHASETAFVGVSDTIVGGVGLKVLTPEHAVPALVLGARALADSAAVLVVQAADVRADNGNIAGAFVLKGDLISKGEAKSGFCAIINGEMTIGVADATPLLEQAIESEGYFFRQYPLVVGGQIVENKPKGQALRKALAEIDGSVRVVLSKEKLSFRDFSQALVDAGARNAIYLVGSSASGRYVDRSGTSFQFGKENESPSENVNYLVWK